MVGYAEPVAKTKEVFICKECGGAQSRWMGKCPDCGAWDTLEPERVTAGAAKDPQRALVQAWNEGADSLIAAAPARALTDIKEEDAGQRLSTRTSELDRVLGGEGTRRGLVPGSAILIGGAPGIGKSTLLLQAAAAMASGSNPTRILYVSSEESAQQVKMRASRLVRGETPGGLFILADTNLARIVEQTRKVLPAVLVIDSIQMIYKSDVPASAGSVTQLRRCCAELVYLAKASGIAIVMVGHVTKDGQLAGPRVLEHMVDAVLNFEGDRYHSHRLVRCIKNRFGTTQEIGIFEMTGEGLREVPEGAGLPAASAGEPRPGSVVCPTISGTRCVLVELQALTATGFIAAAKRKCSGLDPNRLAMIIAVLEQHAELRLADRDIFASAVGGVKVAEPAADLALLLAIAGAQFRRKLAKGTAAVGEVGLGGEVRPVTQLEQRIREAARLGYTRIIVPHEGRREPIAGIEIIPVKTVNNAVQALE